MVVGEGEGGVQPVQTNILEHSSGSAAGAGSCDSLQLLASRSTK